ncbi:MAG: hypothetical protein K2P80_12985 [Beijerinckiaceae bacterium]|nr:hypothetical protein [Beijerinckiaceae bacterium]
MNPLGLISLLGAVMIKDRIRRAKQRAALLCLAAITGLVAAVLFLAAMQIWLAEIYGPFNANLLLGGIFLVICLCFVVTARVMSGSAPDVSTFTKPALRESTKFVARQRYAFASKAPLVIGTTAIIGGLVGRYLSR